MTSEPPCPRIVVNDTTVEKLGELLNENPRGLLLIRDELPGFLTRLESEEQQTERAFYLESFNGNGRFTYDRIGRGTVHIENCTVSIIGGVQPSRIAPIVRGAMSGTSNDGLIQRLQMSVWPDDVRSWQWVDRKPNTTARLTYEKVFRDLYDLPMGDTYKPAILRFSPESQALFQQWMTEIQIKARSGSLPSTLESHMLKLPKTVATLALLFELIEGGRFEVNELAMRRALGWADYLLSHANRLYSAGETMAADGARLIVERRHQLPESVHPARYTAQGMGFTGRQRRCHIGNRDAGGDESLPRSSACGPSERRPTFSFICVEPQSERGGLTMGKWLNQLRENRKKPRDITDKTDKTGSETVLSVLSVRPGGVSTILTPDDDLVGSVSFVGSPSGLFLNFRPFYDGSGWDEEDWEAAFEERAAILEFDQGIRREEAESLAWRQIKTERKRGMQ